MLSWWLHQPVIDIFRAQNCKPGHTRLVVDIVFKAGEFYGEEGSFWKDYIMPVFTASLGAGIGAYVTYRVFRETLIAVSYTHLSTSR